MMYKFWVLLLVTTVMILVTTARSPRVLASGYQCDFFGRKEISLKIDAYLNVAGLIPDTSKYSVKVIL